MENIVDQIIRSGHTFVVCCGLLRPNPNASGIVSFYFVERWVVAVRRLIGAMLARGTDDQDCRITNVGKGIGFDSGITNVAAEKN